MKQQLGSAATRGYVATGPWDARQAMAVRRKRFDIAAQTSILTGADIGRRLHEIGVSAEGFAAVFGLPGPRLHRLLEGDLDGRLPLIVEVALNYLERHGDELLSTPEPSGKGTNRLGYRLSGATGWELDQRLQAIAWSVPDLARFTGLADRTVRNLVRGERDGRITLLLERMVEFAELHPLELQALRRLQTPVRQSPARREAIAFIDGRIGEAARSALNAAND